MKNKVIGKDSFSKDEINIGEEYDIDMVQNEYLFGKVVPLRIKGTVLVNGYEYDEIEICQCCGQEMPEDKKRFKNQSKMECTITAIEQGSYVKIGDNLILRFNKIKESKI